jgi:hypothetical protein
LGTGLRQGKVRQPVQRAVLPQSKRLVLAKGATC